MKFWTLTMLCYAICFGHHTLVESGFTDPLANMSVAQGFGVGTHIGTDLDGNADDHIYAVADGKVFYYNANVSGYGGGGGEGCSAVDGEVIFVRHRKADGSYFIAQYGHIQNVPSGLKYSGFNFNGPTVTKGQIIADIGVFDPCRNCGSRCDHLHFGVWDSNNNIPSNHWGYGDACWTTPVVGCWVNPMTFLQNESPYVVYSTSFFSQTPVGQFSIAQNESRTFTVQFKNEGNSNWHNNSSSYPNDYVELKSCSDAGSVTTSFLNYPYEGSLGWMNSQSPCTMTQSFVTPGGTATFTFTGKVASDASLGVHDVYFRPNHSVGGLMPGWDGMHFQVNVVAPIPEASYTALVGNFNGDALTDIGLYESTNGRWFVAGDQSDEFNQINGPYTNNSWLNDWGTGSGYTPLVGDFNEDGKADFCVYRSQYGRWYVALNNYGTQNSFTQANGPYTESSWMTDWGTGSGFTPLVGDFNGDGKTDICVYRPQYGRWYVALNNYGTQNSFTQSNGPYSESSWLTDWGTGSGYTPLVGDFNGDGKSDIALYQAEYGRWFVAFNNYGTQNSFTQSNGTYTYSSWYTDWGTGSGNIPLVGDFNNDGRSDIAYYQSQYGRWYVAYNDYDTYNRFDVASGTATNGSWLTDWGTSSGMTPLLGNFSTGPHDIGLYDPENGRWFVAFNDYGTAQRFTQADGPYTAYSWYDDWGKESGSPKIVAAGESGPLPVTFALSQNYPNPFNPATMISYSVPEASQVSLTVYNILGQEVAKLVDAYQLTGSYTVPFDAKELPSGVYFYCLHTDQATETRKMVILK